MKSTYKIVNTNSIIFFLALFSTILMFYACGGSGDSGGTAGDTGSMRFSLKFDDISSASVFRAAASPSGDVCVDHQIIDVAVDVYDSSNSVVASDSWPCSAHQGTIDDVPAESDLRLICEGTTVSGDVDWRGEEADITISPGEITDVGTLDMKYVGPPVVESTSPESDETEVSIRKIITATFKGEMLSASINETSFTLTTDSSQIPGTVTYDSSTKQASFKPNPKNSLDYLTTYTATITTEVQDLAGNPMAADYTWSFTTIKDTTSPEVKSTSPKNDETEVSTGITITATYNEEILPASINENSFKLTTDSSQIPGTVMYDPSKLQASFKPKNSLDYDTVYTATITTEVQDLAGNPMAADYTWSFTTIKDTISPEVKSTSPKNDETEVSTGITITATYNEEILPASINENSFKLTTDSSQIPGTVMYDPSKLQASFKPKNSLDYDTVYTATITTEVQDLAGNPMTQEYTWSFTTLNPPEVESTNPKNVETEVSTGVIITATFSEKMLPASINGNSFKLTTDSSQTPGTVTYDSSTKQASFTPENSLNYLTTYTATITTEVKDLAGNPMVQDYSWSFTTSPDIKLIVKVESPEEFNIQHIEAMEVLDSNPNEIVFITQNQGSYCGEGGGTPASAWKLVLDPDTGNVISLEVKQSLSQIQNIRQSLFESSDGTLFTGGGWCGPKPPYYSTDGGETWQPATNGVHPPNSTFSFVEFDGNVYAGTGYEPYHGQVYRWLGEDGYDHWELVYDMDPPRTIVRTMSVYENQMFVGSQIYWGGVIDCETSVPVYASADGNTFNATTGIPNCYSVQDLLVVDEQHVARAQNYFDGTEIYMYRWMNDLEEWQEIAPYNLGSSWIRLVDHNGAIYAYGKAPGDASKGIYQSVDLGQNWKPIVVLENPDVSSMIVQNDTLYIGTEHDMDNNVYIYRILFDDLTPPEVKSTSPKSDETEVPIGVTITATFNEGILSTTTNQNSFTLKTNTSQISGAVTYDPSNLQASFTPDDNLDYDTIYTATITTDVQDLAGNPMAAEYTWSFTTTDGLVAFYPFSGNADDETGNGYDGIIHGDTSLCEDRFEDSDSAYCFDGDGDYIEIGQEPDFPSWDTYALSVWFLNDGGGDNTNSYGQKIIDKTVYWHDFYLRVYTYIGADYGLGSLSWNTYEEGGAGISDTSYDYRDNFWHHAVINKSGSYGELWVDGNLIGTENNIKTVFSSADLLIGYCLSTDPLQRRYWSGKIDDIRIYNRVLSEAEINALYNLDE